MAIASIGASAPALSLGNISVRTLDGLYSLNDLHIASGGNPKHRPGEFLRYEHAKALIAEIENAGIRAFASARGRNGGTYACRELVIAYAAWISPAFHLQVIRVFLDASAGVSQSAPNPNTLLSSGRWLAHTDDHGRLIFKPLPHDAIVTSSSKLASMLAEPGGCHLSNAELIAIAHVCAVKLSLRFPAENKTPALAAA